ncbi:MAG: hypothetical protein P8177_13605, partial [Gemmatimonadota bacterium]
MTPDLDRSLLSRYTADGAYDEMMTPALEPRPPYEILFRRLLSLSQEELDQRQRAADRSFLHRGITFTVSGHDDGTEKIFPYDILPRILGRGEWDRSERSRSGVIRRSGAGKSGAWLALGWLGD